LEHALSCICFVGLPYLLHARAGPHFLAFITFLLAIAVFLAMCVLLGFHTFLVLTGQGTIEMIAHFSSEKVNLTFGIRMQSMQQAIAHCTKDRLL